MQEMKIPWKNPVGGISVEVGEYSLHFLCLAGVACALFCNWSLMQELAGQAFKVIGCGTATIYPSTGCADYMLLFAVGFLFRDGKEQHLKRQE